jgi:hypothetical protein
VIFFGSSFLEHIQRLVKVLQRILDAGLKLKPEKCTILKPEVTFLGHVVSQKGIQPNPDNIAKILSWPAPTNVSEVRQTLGMGSYYRRFIKDFSLMVKPLTELTKKSNEFIWSDICQCSKKLEPKTITSSKYMRQICHCNPFRTNSIRRCQVGGPLQRPIGRVLYS